MPGNTERGRHYLQRKSLWPEADGISRGSCFLEKKKLGEARKREAVTMATGALTSEHERALWQEASTTARDTTRGNYPERQLQGPDYVATGIYRAISVTGYINMGENAIRS